MAAMHVFHLTDAKFAVLLGSPRRAIHITTTLVRSKQEQGTLLALSIVVYSFDYFTENI